MPLADGFKVKIGIEEVWNKFLLSPRNSPATSTSSDRRGSRPTWTSATSSLYGYPQDWIRTLGKRITRLHLKDFRVDRESGKFEWKNIGEGDIDWQAVRTAWPTRHSPRGARPSWKAAIARTWPTCWRGSIGSSAGSSHSVRVIRRRLARRP